MGGGGGGGGGWARLVWFPGSDGTGFDLNRIAVFLRNKHCKKSLMRLSSLVIGTGVVSTHL